MNRVEESLLQGLLRFHKKRSGKKRLVGSCIHCTAGGPFRVSVASVLADTGRDTVKDYLDRMIETVKNNTNGVSFFVNQCVIFLMLFEFIHWTDPQMFGFMSMVNAGMAIFTGKTTIPASQVDRKVDAKVAHRELAGMSGTGDGLVPATAPREIPPTPKEDSEVKTAPSTKIIPLVFAVLWFGAAVASCAQGMRGAAKAEDVAHDGLMAFDRMLDARCDASEITAPTCKQLNSVLVHVWDLKNNLNRTIAGSASTLSVRLADFRAALQALTEKVNQLVQGGAKDLLLRELNLAATQTR